MTTKAQAIKMVEALVRFNPKAKADEVAKAMCELDANLDAMNFKNDRRVYTWWPGRTRLVCSDGEIEIEWGSRRGCVERNARAYEAEPYKFLS